MIAGSVFAATEGFIIQVFGWLERQRAFLIVIFHLFNYSFGWNTALSLVRHAYLAVDFFFGLSGFVVAYAYDDRWTKMSIPQFFRMRESLGNIAYALILRRLRAITLGVIFGLSGLSLIWVANSRGSLDGGWG